MKNIAIIAVAAVTLLTDGCGKKPTAASNPHSPHPSVKTNYSLLYHVDPMLDMSNRIDRSRVVAYASVGTNNLPDMVLTISEVWKGASDASLLGITNGTRLPLRWSAADMADGHFPEHAIVMFPRSDSPSTSHQMSVILYIYEGRTRAFNMTIQEYRAKFGL
jgi:hypothetical protein